MSSYNRRKTNLVKPIFIKATFFVLALVLSICWFANAQAQVSNPQSGSIGLQGTIPTDPPTVGATISFPTNGQTFREIPITVTGICPSDLLVKIFKNQVFAGAVPCESDGTFSIDIDLFSGENELVAIVYDSLDQAGPDSNIVKVTYNDGQDFSKINQLIITSNFALRGADAGTELRWPLAINGGTPPYAISVDWGDGETSLKTLETPGNFEVSHTYFQPGVYKMFIRATDSADQEAIIQLVAVGNGEATQANTSSSDPEITTGASRIYIPMWPIYLMFFLVISTFWIGRKYELRRIKNKIARHEEVRF